MKIDSISISRRELGLAVVGTALALHGRAFAQRDRLRGLIYAVMPNGDLNWYRHDGRGDGSFQWAYDTGRKVGNGWNVQHVFSGGDGIVYAVMPNGDLNWYRHDGRGDGSFQWAYDTGRKVGNGWNVQHVFSG